ncbi:hypothetical protein K502DRAFT_12531 [Neoconidiobolus thromboides FSU 785]|nr:hypothetical protein K502DRAFT_12531 [Neoconidiobolus thromboides FSU 785]
MNYSSMAYILGIHMIDEKRLGCITFEDAIARKVWWEIFTMDSCAAFMLYEEGNIIDRGLPVMMADAHGHSLGFTLHELNLSHIEPFLLDLDSSWRLLPVMRLKMSDLLRRAHNLTVMASKSTDQASKDKLEPLFLELRMDLAYWSRFASPNPFISDINQNSIVGGTGLPTSPGDHPSTQASGVLLFNCAYILAYCPTLYWTHERITQEKGNEIPDSCGVAAGYLICGIDLARPENPRGERWHQVLPFFSYIGCLAYYRLFTAYPHNKEARATASSQFELLYLELANSIRYFPVADLFMAKLRPFRNAINESFTEFDSSELVFATSSPSANMG